MMSENKIDDISIYEKEIGSMFDSRVLSGYHTKEARSKANISMYEILECLIEHVLPQYKSLIEYSEDGTGYPGILSCDTHTQVDYEVYKILNIAGVIRYSHGIYREKCYTVLVNDMPSFTKVCQLATILKRKLVRDEFRGRPNRYVI